ncbi:MAG: hypothetical protein KAS32_07465 [Candidatus Peribacteraceae bacterium]|nr:hypothetical protein [Candidatus Peribacteraceae bacterium]
MKSRDHHPGIPGQDHDFLWYSYRCSLSDISLSMSADADSCIYVGA